MRKGLRLILFVFLLNLLFIPMQASANSKLTPSLPMIQDYFVSSRQTLLDLPCYQIMMTLKDLTTNQIVMESQMLGDSNEQKQFHQVLFYEYQDERTIQPMKSQLFQFMSYPKINELYGNHVEMDASVQSMNGIRSVQEIISIPWQTLTLAPNQALESIQLSNELLIPSAKQLKHLNAQLMTLQDESLVLEAHRIEIPLDFMKQSGERSFKAQWMDRIDNEHEYLEMYGDNSAVVYEEFYPREFIQWEFLKELHENDDLQENKRSSLSFFEQAFNQNNLVSYQFDSRFVTQKMTDIKFMINPTQQIYTANLTGLYENFDLNFMDQQGSGNYGLIKYQLIIEMMPYEGKLPNASELYLNEEINQTKENQVQE